MRKKKINDSNAKISKKIKKKKIKNGDLAAWIN